MRTTSSAETCVAGSEVSLRSSVAAKLLDYAELTKPRIALLVLVTVTVGYTVGSAGGWHLVSLGHALFGIALVAAAASAWNQLLERHSDACMQRTAERPLPAGRMMPAEALLFGLLIGGWGLLHLAVWVNPLTAVLAILTWLLYSFAYTSLKRVTSLCTSIGAVAGALPPVLGWTAAGGTLDGGAFAIFAILFLWQFPHFLAIGWLYRRDYAKAGVRMLPSSKLAPRLTGSLCVIYVTALLPVSFLPRELTLAGDGYLLAAVLLGLGYLACSIWFMLQESTGSARGVLISSLLYLPLLLLALTWDHLRLVH